MSVEGTLMDGSSLNEQMLLLRKVIPGFDERCRNFYLSWKYMMEQRKVTRMGCVKMHFYKHRTVQSFLPWSMPINDAEHVFGMMNAVVLFRDFFGEYIPKLYGFQPDWMEYIEQAMFHEIGEITIGDWTDDGGHDRQKKDRLEQYAFDEFMRPFPEQAQRRHQREFADLRDGKTNMKLFDKEAFLLEIAYFKSKGVCGSLKRKTGITEQDKRSCKLLQSYRPFDIIFVDMLNRFRSYGFLPFIVGINEAIYAIEFNEIDPLVKDCVPGIPPARLKALY